MIKTLHHLLVGIVCLIVGFFGFRLYEQYASGATGSIKNLASLSNSPTPTPALVIDPASLTWQREPSAWEKRDSHSIFTFKGKMWILGGLDSDNSKINGVPDYEKSIYYNDIWNTSDGVTWTRVKEHADFPYIRSASVIAFKGSVYMYGGWSPNDGLKYANGIWKSDDGINWKKIVDKPDYPEREGQIVLEWNGKLWLVGGVDYFGRKTFNDVWSSDDGVHWTAATTDAPWHSRWDHALGIINGKMYIAGGMNFNGVGYSDEWVSSDGAHWDLVSANAAWGERQGQEIVIYGGYAWLISGLHSASNQGKGDAWYTKDGVNWTKAPDDYQWKGREDHAVIVFNDRIWVMGGMDSDWHWNDDIWASTFTMVPENEVGKATPPPAPQVSPQSSSITAESYISISIDENRPSTGADAYPIGQATVLAEKNKDEKLPIASVTKLMTALVATEHIASTDTITISADALAGKGSAGEIKAGETFSLHDLLTLLLLPSDNDSAMALAEKIGIPDFVKFMNEKAAAIGMTNTEYRNPTGLDEDTVATENLSTASDLSKLAVSILTTHPEIFAITRTPSAVISDTAGTKHTITSTDALLSDPSYNVIGGKTGETPSALKNLVLVTLAPDGKSHIISVVLHSQDNFADMKKLLNLDATLWKK